MQNQRDRKPAKTIKLTKLFAERQEPWHAIFTWSSGKIVDARAENVDIDPYLIAEIRDVSENDEMKKYAGAYVTVYQGHPFYTAEDREALCAKREAALGLS